MPKITISDLKSKSLDQLILQLQDSKKELFNLRFQSANSQLKNSGRIKEVRRGIARVKTLINGNGNKNEKG